MDPDNILDDLGRDLFVQWLILKYYGKDTGDPVVIELAQLQRSVVQVLISRQFGNRGISHESQAESMKSLSVAAERFAQANHSKAA